METLPILRLSATITVAGGNRLVSLSCRCTLFRVIRIVSSLCVPLPAHVITVSGAQPVIEYEVSANGGGDFGGTIEGLANVTVTCSPEFLAQAQISHSYLP